MIPLSLTTVLKFTSTFTLTLKLTRMRAFTLEITHTFTLRTLTLACYA